MYTYIRLQNMFAQLKDSERGATAVEYGLMVALIAAVIVAVVSSIGGQLNTAFENVDNELTTVAGP